MKLFNEIDKRISEAENLLAEWTAKEKEKDECMREKLTAESYMEWCSLYDRTKELHKSVSLKVHNIASMIDFPLKKMDDYREYRGLTMFWENAIRRIKLRIRMAKEALNGR